MQTQNKFFIGIDASKLWFDLGLIRVTQKGREKLIRQKFDNNAAGLRSLGTRVLWKHPSYVLVYL